MVAKECLIDTFDKIKAFNEAALSVVGKITVRQDDYVVDGRSMMGLFSLDLSRTIIVDLESEEEADAFQKALLSIYTDKYKKL